MTAHVAYPYRTAPGTVVLEVLSASDGLAVRPDGVIDAFAEGPGILQIDLSVKPAWADVESLIAAGESPSSSTALVLIERSIASRIRRAHPVDESGLVSLTLRRCDHRGEVEFTAQVVRTRPSPGDPGVASATGSALAWSDPVRLLFDEPDSPRGGSIEIRWVDFTEDPLLHDRHLFAVRIAERPQLLLNQAIPELYAVLESTGTTGAKARIREAVYMQIVHQTWSSLVGHAYCELQRVITDTDLWGLDAVEELGGWMEVVLRDWAPELHPKESDRDTALKRLVEDARSGADDMLVSRLTAAVQERFSTWKGYEGLVRQAGIFGSEGGDA